MLGTSLTIAMCNCIVISGANWQLASCKKFRIWKKLYSVMRYSFVPNEQIARIPIIPNWNRSVQIKAAINNFNVPLR